MNRTKIAIALRMLAEAIEEEAPANDVIPIPKPRKAVGRKRRASRLDDEVPPASDLEKAMARKAMRKSGI